MKIELPPFGFMRFDITPREFIRWKATLTGKVRSRRAGYGGRMTGFIDFEDQYFREIESTNRLRAFFNAIQVPQEHDLPFTEIPINQRCFVGANGVTYLGNPPAVGITAAHPYEEVLDHGLLLPAPTTQDWGAGNTHGTVSSQADPGGLGVIQTTLAAPANLELGQYVVANTSPPYILKVTEIINTRTYTFRPNHVLATGVTISPPTKIIVRSADFGGASVTTSGDLQSLIRFSFAEMTEEARI